MFLALFTPISLKHVITLHENLDAILFFASIAITVRGLEFSGVLNKTVVYIVSWVENPKTRSITLVIATALASMIMMNDASLFIFIPMARMMAKYVEGDEKPLIVSVIIAANLGSSLTPIGNPQNIYIWRVYRIPFLGFMRSMAAFTLISLSFLLIALVLRDGSRGFKSSLPPSIKVERTWASVSFILLGIIVLGAELGYIEYVFILTLCIYMVLFRRRIRPDYKLILLFTLMVFDFSTLSNILIKNFGNIKLKDSFNIFLAGISLSQVISNVPATIVLSGTTRKWLPLIIGTNLGGIGLLPGSLANIIGVRLGRIKAADYHRYALKIFIPLTILFSIIFLFSQ